MLREPSSGEKYGSAFDKMMAHVRDQPPSLLTVRPKVPQSLVAVLERMMAKHPDERFAVPGDVAAALAPFTSGCNLTALASMTESIPSTTAPVDTSLAATDAYLSQPSTGTHANEAPGAAASARANSFNPSPSGAGVAVSNDSLAADTADAARKPVPGVTAKRTARRPAVLIALGLLGILILAGVIFKLKTREGTLVECDQWLAEAKDRRMNKCRQKCRRHTPRL